MDKWEEYRIHPIKEYFVLKSRTMQYLDYIGSCNRTLVSTIFVLRHMSSHICIFLKATLDFNFMFPSP